MVILKTHEILYVDYFGQNPKKIPKIFVVLGFSVSFYMTVVMLIKYVGE